MLPEGPPRCLSLRSLALCTYFRAEHPGQSHRSPRDLLWAQSCAQQGWSACRSRSSILPATEVWCAGMQMCGDICKALRASVNRGSRSVPEKFTCSHKKLERLSGQDLYHPSSLLSLQENSSSQDPVAERQFFGSKNLNRVGVMWIE